MVAAWDLLGSTWETAGFCHNSETPRQCTLLKQSSCLKSDTLQVRNKYCLLPPKLFASKSPRATP